MGTQEVQWYKGSTSKVMESLIRRRCLNPVTSAGRTSVDIRGQCNDGVSGEVLCCIFAFSALTLLVGWQEGHPACKKLSGGVLVWFCVWSEVQTCIWPS